MTTVTAAPPNPTVSDARRAAAELANVGVSRVLLFGSVAQGKAKVGSDIDLVAMFDDIDYSQRRQLRSSLCTAAEAVVQCRVEVFVTDRAEWRHRTQKVSASFEAGIAPTAVVLVDRPVGVVRWDKEIGLPDNNTDEALGRLDETSKALHSMYARMRPDEWEVLDSEGVHISLWRLIDICSAGAMAVETSLKALAAANGVPAPHKHRIDLLVPLSGSRTHEVTGALADLEQSTIDDDEISYSDLTIWRQAGTYIADRPEIDLPMVSTLAPRIAGAAVAVAAIVTDQMAAHSPDAGAVVRARRIVQQVSKILSTHDLLTGKQTGGDTS